VTLKWTLSVLWAMIVGAFTFAAWLLRRWSGEWWAPNWTQLIPAGATMVSLPLVVAGVLVAQQRRFLVPGLLLMAAGVAAGAIAFYFYALLFVWPAPGGA
jgi:hypothetical protein